MQSSSTSSSHKRAVDLSLSDGVVAQTRSCNANLFATLEAQLIDDVAAQQCTKATRQQQANGWCAGWNAVHAALGSFADEHTTL